MDIFVPKGSLSMTSIALILASHPGVRLLILETKGRRRVEVFLDETSQFYNLNTFDLNVHAYRLVSWID